uniref:GP3 protein n=1 Tax=Free State vervet virus TaxID=1737586 RepID=A0A159D6Q1_9NIDO|nr:GP3 protein [Free State vervet virus]
MGHYPILAVLSFSSLLCSVYSYCFVLPDPDIHIQVFLNYTTCHMQGTIIAGYQSLGNCQSFKHDQFSGTFGPFNLNYSTSAPIGAVVLGLSLLTHVHQNCTWQGKFYCCTQYSPPSRTLEGQPLPHLVLLAGGAMLLGIMSACLAMDRRSTMFRV